MSALSESKANQYLPALNNAMNEGNINTCPRKAAFLAQLAHESGQLRYWEELASGAAYEGRKDLGNTQRGDGVRYKGRGPIQLTGRSNYRSAGAALGLPLEQNPKMVSETNVGFKTSIWFWNSRRLSSLADANNQSSFDQITRRINGGTNGRADRNQYWQKAKRVLGC
jgi:predicted chitinase